MGAVSRGSTRTEVTLVILLMGLCCFATACGNSLVDPHTDYYDTSGDGGPILDASDDRDIPETCTDDTDCDDDDPCTNEACWQGVCAFSLKSISLSATDIPTAHPAVDVALGNGRLYVAEGDAGVEIFDITDLSAPQQLGMATTTGEALSVSAAAIGFVVGEGDWGLETFTDAETTPYVPIQSETQGLDGIERVVDVGVGPGHFMVAGYDEGLAILNGDLGNPAGLGYLDTCGRALAASGDLTTSALVADSLGGAVAIINNGDGTFALGGRLDTAGRVQDVSVARDTGLMAEFGSGFSVIDFSDPLFPERLAISWLPSPCIASSLLGAQTGVLLQENGTIAVYDLRDAFIPAVVDSATTPHLPVRLDVSDGLIAVALGANGAILYQTGCTLD